MSAVVKEIHDARAPHDLPSNPLDRASLINEAIRRQRAIRDRFEPLVSHEEAQAYEREPR